MAGRSSVLHVMGEVVGKPRPRFTTVGGHVKTYPSAKGESFEGMVRLAYQMQGGVMHKGPVTVTIAYRRKMPKSRPKRQEWEWDVFKPDVDNVEKAVLDALSGVAFEDDRCVVCSKTMKMPRVRTEAEELYVLVEEVTEETRKELEDTWQRFTSSLRTSSE